MQRTEYWGISLRRDEGEMPASLLASDVPTLKRGLLRGALACFVLAAGACGGAQGPHAGALAPAAHDSAVARTVDSLGAAIAQVAQDSAADQQVLDSLHRPPRADTLRAHRDSAPPAVSRAKAVGMWQFMASTARLYGLTVDPWVDERRDPFKATEAAVNYLADLRERLGSVYLAAAAYNAGVGRIERGIGRLPGAGGRGGSGGEADSVSDLTFFQLADRRYLRRETRDYVPKLIAASLIAKQPGRYGFDEIKPLPPLAFDEISIADATGLDVIARLADTSVAAILELNPQFVRGVTPPGRVVVLRVPRGRGTHVAERYDSLPVTERITFVDHYVSRGQTLSEIAKRYRVNVAMIESANPRLKAHALRVGQRIIIPMSGRVVPAAAWSIPPESRYRRVSRTEASTGSYRVRTGETASEIARRYGVPLTALLNYNGLTLASVIRAGDVIKIPQK